MPTTRTFTYVPTYSTQIQVQRRVLQAQFGDGYVQEALDGKNATPQTWQLVWRPIYTDQGTPSALDLHNFFSSLGTETYFLKFLWTPPAPLAVQSLYVCHQWGWVYEEGKEVGFQAVFNQRPS